jgi:hypothetical protein
MGQYAIYHVRPGWSIADEVIIASLQGHRSEERFEMRFSATILEHHPNPYVDVPADVSAAFAEYAVAGKIRFEGVLNETTIRGTLMPVAGGGHRLYVNGGMRSAAGVSVGDTISLDVTAVGPETVNPPADVVAGLHRTEGAQAAFDALPPSRRRELLRYIDDARTPAMRQCRIATTATHVLGGAPAARSRAAPPVPPAVDVPKVWELVRHAEPVPLLPAA